MVKKTSDKKSEKADIHITGMTCATCAATIEKGLAETYGVESAKVNSASEKAIIEYDPSKVSLISMKDAIAYVRNSHVGDNYADRSNL